MLKGRLLLDVLMVGLIILGIGIPTGIINVGPISGQLAGDPIFRATVVLALDIAVLGLVLVLGLLKLNRMAQLFASLIVIESVVLGITTLEFGWVSTGFVLAVACVSSLVLGSVISSFFKHRVVRV